MTSANDRTSWRGSFVAALNALAQAAARLPVGVLDPALSGASAIELYTGGQWSTPDIELVCEDPRPLVSELFVDGFRWIQRPRRGRRMLWHPELQVGVDLAERSAPLGVAERANALAVAIDLSPNGEAEREPLSLKVVGIEDLIVRQVGAWLRDGTAPGEAAAKLQALVGLALGGVGGPLCAGYLQRQLASETDGEVVFESLSADEGGTLAPQLRRTSLTQMQTVIRLWRSRCGLSVVPRSWRGHTDTDGMSARMVPNRNGSLRRGRGCGASVDNVIALDGALPELPD
jgi:hypothetical protein